MNKSAKHNLIYIEDFNYPLPDERIAKFPLTKRDSSKLLLYKDGEINEDIFSNIMNYLPESSLLVYNNTRVIHARLEFYKGTGARIEIFCLEPLNPSDYVLSLGATQQCIWKCMIGNLKKWKSGSLTKQIDFKGNAFDLSAELIKSENNVHEILFSWNNANVHFADILEQTGELPIPPYLNRRTEASDNETYQTVYSKIEGSVAAPTAGLHFTPEVLGKLKEKNIQIEEITLHVGAGTFQPVKSDTIDQHQMHSEVIEVPKSVIEQLRSRLGDIIAVGTTSVRTLESLYYIGLQIIENQNSDFFKVSQWMPYETNSNILVSNSLQAIVDYMNKNNLSSLHASTQIMIKPGYEFKVVNGIITNFHQPKSTLLLLVSAFVKGNWKAIYNYALSHNFRFLSYGDSSLLFP